MTLTQAELRRADGGPVRVLGHAQRLHGLLAVRPNAQLGPDLVVIDALLMWRYCTSRARAPNPRRSMAADHR